MDGFVTSPLAARALEFLERVGPTPFPALAAALGVGPGKLAKALRHLRGAGFAFPVRRNGAEFWCPDGSRPGPGQEALAWFAAKLEGAGGRYEGGTAKFPGGQEFEVKVTGGRVLVGGRWEASLADLKERPLRECLKRAEG